MRVLNFTACVLLQVLLGSYAASVPVDQTDNRCLHLKLPYDSITFIYESPSDVGLLFHEDLYIVQFDCPPKHHLVGSRFIQCVDGRWTDEVPFCANCLISVKDFTDGSIIYKSSIRRPNFRCSSKYYLVGENSMRCGHEEWTDEIPFCAIPECPKPPEVENAKYHVKYPVNKSPKAGSSVTYTCKEGYEGRVSTLRCVFRKFVREVYWNGELPSCKKILCDLPPPLENGTILELQSTNLTSFPYNFEITYVCDTGYHLIGDSLRSCEKGGWSGQTPTCEEILCDLPPPLENGTILELQSTNLTSFPYNFEITYVCDTGHHLIGDSWRLCEKKGWSGKTPTCEVTLCPDPGVPENGDRKGDNKYIVGSSVHFSCFRGYELLGSVQRHCMPDGQWSGELARCNLPSINYCPNPGIPIKGFKNTTNYDLGIKIGFGCEAGYIQLGSQVRECLNNHTWSGTETKCLVAECPKPPEVENAKYHVKSPVNKPPNFGSSVTYTCKEGYELNDTKVSTLHCFLSKSPRIFYWRGEIPSCKEKLSCPDPGVSPSGSRKGKCCLSGTSLHFRCDEDYELVGKEIIHCLPTGNWSSLRPLCKPLNEHCEFPPRISHGLIEGDKIGDYFRPGEEAQVLCEPGYKCKGPEFVICEEGGQWESEFGNCTEIFCDLPPTLENGIILELQSTNLTSFPYNFEVTYVCDTGYHLIGNSSRVCGKRGWSGKTPTCEDYSQCGRGLENLGNNNGRGRIVGGQKSKEPWPWMAALYMQSIKDDPTKYELKCGGTIIHRNFILTAAHCMYRNLQKNPEIRDRKSIIIKLGLTDVKNESYVQESDVLKMFVHPKYRPGSSFDYDIALLQMERPAEYNLFVRHICLPPAELPYGSLLYLPQSTAWTTGWGRHTGRVSKNPDNVVELETTQNLKEISLPIQSKDRCLETILDNGVNGSFFTDRMFCAGDGKGGNDTCQGDSGGPLMQSLFNSEGYVYWIQVGIVSWGIGCDLQNTFGYFTNVQKLVPWVHETIENALKDVNG